MHSCEVQCECAGARKANVSLKEIGPSLLIVLVSLLAFICGIADFDVNENAPKAIALCWVLYNIVPHLLLLTYARFGVGKVLHHMCSFLFSAQSVISLLALVLLWVLYPREENYVKATNLSLRFLYAQWSGDIVQPFPIDWRRSSGAQNKNYEVNQTRFFGQVRRKTDLSQGFYTEGELGPVKVTTHIALTTAMLSWSMLEFKDWWAKDEQRRSEGIKIIKHGLEYVLNSYIPAPNLNGTDKLEDPWAPQDVLVYVVCIATRLLHRRVLYPQHVITLLEVEDKILPV
jgi:hypothetical protein